MTPTLRGDRSLGVRGLTVEVGDAWVPLKRRELLEPRSRMPPASVNDVNSFTVSTWPPPAFFFLFCLEKDSMQWWAWSPQERTIEVCLRWSNPIADFWLYQLLTTFRCSLWTKGLPLCRFSSHFGFLREKALSWDGLHVAPPHIVPWLSVWVFLLTKKIINSPIVKGLCLWEYE